MVIFIMTSKKEKNDVGVCQNNESFVRHNPVASDATDTDIYVCEILGVVTVTKERKKKISVCVQTQMRINHCCIKENKYLYEIMK